MDTQVISTYRIERSYPLVETTISKNWIIYKVYTLQGTKHIPYQHTFEDDVLHIPFGGIFDRSLEFFFLCKFGGEMTRRSFKSNPNHIEAFQIHAVNLRLSSSLIEQTLAQKNEIWRLKVSEVEVPSSTWVLFNA